MSRVGILTYHREPNPGSVLQAHCTYKLVQGLADGRPTELLDYRSRVSEVRHFRSLLWKGWPPVDHPQLSKVRALRRFLTEQATVSKIRITERNASRILSRNGYDTLVVGSDTVWEVNRKGHAPLAPNLYHLPGVPARTKIAFAVSADTTDLSLLDKDRHRVLSRCVADFDLVLVRDAHTEQFVRDLGLPFGRIGYLPDPTILWDLSDFVGPGPPIERPWGVVAVDDLGLRHRLSEALSQMGYEALNLLGPPVEGQRSLDGPFSLPGFLGAHGTCDLMITDRFHGSIFTLLYGRAPVVLLELPGKYPKPSSKGRDLLARLGAEEMVWRYEGEPVTPERVQEFVKRWNGLDDPRERLRELRIAAAPQLKRVRSLLAREGSGS